jgi:predicted O-methyltransferase YrrM
MTPNDLFDHLSVIEQVEEQITQAGVADRCELIAGDFFKEVPQGGDAYFLRHILLDWEDEECEIILRNCIQAMKPGGRILVAEEVLEPGQADLLSKLIDLTLMVDQSGHQREEQEFQWSFCLRAARHHPRVHEHRQRDRTHAHHSHAGDTTRGIISGNCHTNRAAFQAT